MTNPLDPTQQQKLLALGQLAGGVAHDFNNILSIIEGYTRMLQRHFGDDPVAMEKLRNISLATKRGGALTRQMLAFGRQQILPNKVCDLVAVVRENEILLHPLLTSRVTLTMLTPDDAIFVPCDPDTISQILMNLATNARDAITNTGNLRIEIVATAKHAYMLVTDNGTGIAADALGRIFDPFFTTKEQGKGTGLGLSMIAGIMQQVGGTVTVDSTIGHGTCFTLEFPRVDALRLASEGVLSRPESSLHQKTILIVDDEEELLGIIEDDLQRLGLRVLKAANAERAMVLQQHYKDSIDLLLTDIVMPGTSGVKLAEMFSEFRPDTGVVFMTGYPYRGDAARNLSPLLPDNALVLPKPFQTTRLSETLQKALDRVGKVDTPLTTL